MEVKLAKKGTPLATFQKVRTDAISEMFDNPDKYGLYPTGIFFAKLDACVEQLLKEVPDKGNLGFGEALSRHFEAADKEAPNVDK